MKDLLIRLLDSEQLTASKFADIIGVQRSSVSHVLSGRNKPSFDFIEKTLKAFPDVNSEWLILGKGEMTNGTADLNTGTLFDVPHKKDKMINEIQTEKPADINREERIKQSKDPDDLVSDFTSSQMITEKKVIKVMLFYDDHTFASFNPSN